jgi:ubiquinone/menaquinone biosynthesis C-methylase UbiE
MSASPGDDARDTWSGVADAWAQGRPRVAAEAGRRAEAWLLENAGLEAGKEVLEIACGTGSTGVEAARLVAPEGRVLMSDFADAMVDAARERARREGVDNAECEVLDAQHLGLPDASFDAVICGFGLMLMPEPVRAAAEARRVLRPGGRLVLTVWAEEAANAWLAAAMRALMEELGAPEPEEGMPGPFALGSAQRLEEILSAAGFESVEVERVQMIEPHESPESWWSAVETSAGPIVAVLAGLSDDTRAAIRRRALERVEQYRTASSLDLPTAFNAAVAAR